MRMPIPAFFGRRRHFSAGPTCRDPECRISSGRKRMENGEAGTEGSHRTAPLRKSIRSCCNCKPSSNYRQASRKHCVHIFFMILHFRLPRIVSRTNHTFKIVIYVSCRLKMPDRDFPIILFSSTPKWRDSFSGMLYKPYKLSPSISLPRLCACIC